MSFKAAAMKLQKREPKPKGWSTLAEVAADMGVSGQTACTKLNAMHRAGLVEKRPWMKWGEDGRASKATIYRLVK